MKENLKFAWAAVWFALIGQLLIFMGISLYTGDWRYIMWSFIAGMMAGVPGLINTWQAQKKADEKSVKKDQ
ncbi:hypothetical protein [Gracilibacillus sp. Marseille-QA3620]